MKTIQQELMERGFIGLCAKDSTVDMDIYRCTPNPNEVKDFPPIAHIAYSDIKGKTGFQALEFVISKLPKDETK